MKFAISYSTPYYGADPDRIVAFARHAEDRGFEAMYVPEHIAVYPGVARRLRRYAHRPSVRDRTQPASNCC
jgi:alkanesulfonate monooxygenase SsuD/methylene tetrahydromethanopterin reductase-like flavin-dependent oxidoreductase (luciferase family)